MAARGELPMQPVRVDAHGTQLIGYSLSGFGDLSYVSDEAFERAAKAEKKLRKKGPK